MKEDHRALTPHLTRGSIDHLIEQTYLGQAHFAATGPQGRTCRECRFWHNWTRPKKDSDDDPQPRNPTYDKAGDLKKARCNRPIANKPKRAVPHFALACRLFEAAAAPKPAHDGRKPR